MQRAGAKPRPCGGSKGFGGRAHPEMQGHKVGGAMPVNAQRRCQFIHPDAGVCLS